MSPALTTIDFPGATQTIAFGIDSSGDIVGSYVQASLRHGFVLSRGTFTTIDVFGAASTALTGSNPEGDLVGGYVSAGVNHGVLFSGGTVTTIDVPGANLSARDIQALFVPFGFIEYEKRSGIRADVGLYLCHQIVQLHGGRVDVSDTGPGIRFLMVVRR